jgi:hypothetical protein
MNALVPVVAAVLGFFAGTLLVSRVGSWVQVLVSDRHPVVFILHSGPWLLAATIYAAYYLLRPPHAPAWDWFFGAVGVTTLLWIPILIFLAHRKRTYEKGSKD